MSNKNNFLLIFLSLVSLCNCVYNRKVDVTILYESLCPDSLKFINEQLYQNWAELSPYVNLNLIPFGKSSSMNGGQHFKCQHGPMECVGNKIQSCALNAIEDPNAQVEFVHCFMNSFVQKDVGKSCATKIGLNWSYIDRCYSSPTGILLQLHAEYVTKSVLPRFVPTIIYNGIFNQEHQNESLNDFKGVVCKHLNTLYSGGICS